LKKPIDIIIPTWNNEQYLNPCVTSIIRTGVLNDYANLIIVNNGKQDIERNFGGHTAIKILTHGENLGWEGGLKYGLEHSDADYVVFQNDDTFIPQSSVNLYMRLLMYFQNQNVAAVGPITTVAAGVQSVFHPQTPLVPTEVSYLIFFTVMLRRKYLDEVGGVDSDLPGGDDFDLCIRLRNKGYHLLVNPAAFIIHHGFKTGERVKGTPDVRGGWNSMEMQERTNRYLIKKHGLKTFINTLRGLTYTKETTIQDTEGSIIRASINGEVNILELGCGAQKTVGKAIGVDIIPKGGKIPNLNGTQSVADVVADVQERLPFEDNSQEVIIARHIIEHCLDVINTLKEWKRVLKPGGMLILAVPDERITSGIPLNPEHCHAFNPGSLKGIVEAVGFKEIKNESSGNGVSFVGWYKKCD